MPGGQKGANVVNHTCNVSGVDRRVAEGEFGAVGEVVRLHRIRMRRDNSRVDVSTLRAPQGIYSRIIRATISKWSPRETIPRTSSRQSPHPHLLSEQHVRPPQL